ncbi:MAG TPA: hypothetical protein VJI73_04160 [Candidatus Paceibacterota bacterium]
MPKLSFWKAFTDGSKSKINNTSAVLMVSLAFLIDLAQLLLGLIDGGTFTGPLIMIFQFGVYSLWFGLKGVSFWGKRKMATKVVSGILELIPVLNDFIPSTSVMVIASVGITRLEEAGIVPGKPVAKNLKQMMRSKQRPKDGTGSNLLNAKRTPKERRARFQGGRPPERSSLSTPTASTNNSNVLDLRGDEKTKLAI